MQKGVNCTKLIQPHPLLGSLPVLHSTLLYSFTLLYTLPAWDTDRIFIMSLCTQILFMCQVYKCQELFNVARYTIPLDNYFLIPPICCFWRPVTIAKCCNYDQLFHMPSTVLLKGLTCCTDRLAIRETSWLYDMFNWSELCAALLYRTVLLRVRTERGLRS